MKQYKRQLQVLCMIITMMLLYTSWYTYGMNNNVNTSALHDGIIRFHVIANSNSVEDQNLKLAVRDEVLATINEKLIYETMRVNDDPQTGVTLTVEESRQYILENLTEIESIAENVIQENGFAYSADANLGMCWIPEKKYDDIVYPAGNYEALNITIGAGEGENWWCVLFPPLCTIDAGGNDGKGITIDGIDLAAGPDMRASVGGIRLKFKTVEIVDSLSKN